MPRKQKKSKEESLAENYFPVDETDLKYAVEKPFKGSYSEYHELIERKPKRKKKAAKKSYKRASKKTAKKSAKKSFGAASYKEEFKPQKISLKKDGYELIITEKPQAAEKIASALGKAERKGEGGVYYYDINRNGKRIIVACAVGHLFTLRQNVTGSQVPVFDISWVPNYMAMKKDFTKKYYNTILKLAKNAGSITIATDYDIEGEVIGLNIVRYLCGQEDANRMKYSTLTPKELNESYEQKFSHIDWGQAIAGETRHYLDWMYGINLSRALMNAIKSTGRFKIMSIGRVQGPALKLIVDRERQIQNFKPETYWQVFITVQNSHKVELKHNKDIFDKSRLSEFDNIVGRTTIAETKKREQKIPPNPPFDLTTLQTDAYKFHGITPARTLQIAQGLYLSGLISYPRTSSQKLPASINYNEILKKIADQFNASHLIKRQKPIEGKKSDPAHPSIYPTGQTQMLSGDDEKIYNLIARRFLALFCDDAIVDNKTIKTEIDTSKRKVEGQGNLGVLTFSANGSSIRQKGWMEVYPSKMKESELPDLEGEVKVINMRTEEKETQPPKRFSPASIISALEKRNLGTKATRSSIVETLFDRGYVKDKSIEATPLGMSLVETMEKYSPIIIDENLTREFEKEMDSIQKLKSGYEEKENEILDKAEGTIKKIAGNFEEHNSNIGQELLQANIKLNEQRKEENSLNGCPKCGQGLLTIMYSKKTRRYFVACDKYPDCRNTYTLPPNGIIKKTGKNCEDCGFPMLQRLAKGKRPWEFCFNPDCEKNRERLEEYRKRKEAEQKGE